MSATRGERQQRVEVANAMINIIAINGRQFFRYKDRVGCFGLDCRGHLFYRDAYSQRDIFIKKGWRSRRGNGFTEGGTMKGIIGALAKYIRKGQTLHPRCFGPWPDWICDGDLWGYGEDMEKVRLAARMLGIVEEDSQP